MSCKGSEQASVRQLDTEKGCADQLGMPSVLRDDGTEMEESLHLDLLEKLPTAGLAR